MISYQSLLLSTTVLNDINTFSEICNQKSVTNVLTCLVVTKIPIYITPACA